MTPQAAEAFTMFRFWVEARTGLAFEHQSAESLERLRKLWNASQTCDVEVAPKTPPNTPKRNKPREIRRRHD